METKTRNLLAFWCLGLVNNMPYVVMMAGAKEINNGGVGLVYFFQIFPSLAVQLTGPYWFHLVSYRMRIYLCGVCMALSFLTVAFGEGMLWLQLIGVTFSGIQSGMGESSILALTSFYDYSRTALTCWSSGTGAAGVAGYAWVTLFSVGLNAPLKVTVLVGLIFPVTYVAIYKFILIEPKIQREIGEIGVATEDADEKLKDKEFNLIEDPEHKEDRSAMDTLSIQERLRATLTLWPYMVPLIVVYCAEYALQAGTWAAIGFPITDTEARNTFYRYAGFAYQAGVFISRSSGSIIQINRLGLALMSIAQCGMLILFWFIARYQFWYDWSLIVPCLIVGLFGGGVYVNGFTLIAKESPPHLTEFSLTAASVSGTIGIMFADIAGLFLQGCLYSIHNLPDAYLKMSC